MTIRLIMANKEFIAISRFLLNDGSTLPVSFSAVKRISKSPFLRDVCETVSVWDSPISWL